jgi:hypothetical protein
MAAPSLPTGMDPLVAQLRIIHLQASFKDLDAHALARWLTSIIFAIISPMASSAYASWSYTPPFSVRLPA